MTERGIRPMAAIAHMCHNILTRGYGSQMTAHDLAREIQAVLPKSEVVADPTDGVTLLIGRLLEAHYGGAPLIAVDMGHDWEDVAAGLLAELRADAWAIATLRFGLAERCEGCLARPGEAHEPRCEQTT